MPDLHLHGPSPRIVDSDGRREPLASREAALLAWLHRRGPTPRARLAGLLWPAGDEAKARANLRQLLLRLKRHAGRLVDEQDGLLRLAGDVRVAAPASGAELLSGHTFDDAPDLADWLRAEREQAARDGLRSALAAAQAALGAGDLDAALAAADGALALDDTSEEAWRLRMEAQYRRGDRAAAIASWDACRLALKAAFGVLPSPATQQLGQALLAQAQAAEAGPLQAQPDRALRHPPHLAGRAALLDEAEAALAQGQWLLIAGPGGIGKTRVVQALAARCGAASVVAARLGDAHTPMALAERLLHALAPRYAGRLDAAMAAALDGRAGLADSPAPRSALALRQAEQAALLALRAATDSGLALLAIEDLHHADAASIAWLRGVLGAALAEHGALPALPVLLSARLEACAPATRAWLDELAAEPRVRRHVLPPLAAADVRALVATLRGGAEGVAPGRADAGARAGDGAVIGDGVDDGAGADTATLADWLWQHIGGNPAHLLEALRSARAGQPFAVPAGLVESVAARLALAPPEALLLAQLAAVAEADFDAGLAAATTGRGPVELAAALAWLESAQVFVGGRLAHDLIAQGALATVQSALRPALHQRIAAALIERQDAAPAARIAHHLDAAGEPHAAAAWHVRAGCAAWRAWRLDEAVASYGRAAERLAPHADRAALLDARLALAQLQPWRGDTAAAAAELAAAQPLLLHDEDHARWLARAVGVHHNARRLDAARDAAEALVTRLQRCAGRLGAAELARALAMACRAIQHGGPQQEVLALCEQAGERLLAAGSDSAALWSHSYGQALHWLGQPRAALRVLDAGWARLDDACDPSTRLDLLNQRMRVRHSCGELARCIEHGEELVALAGHYGAGVIFQCDALCVRACFHAASGAADAALADFDELERRMAAAGEPMREAFLTSRAHVWLMAGQPQRAREALARIATPLAAAPSPLYASARLWAEACVAAALGEAVAPWLDRLRRQPPLPPGPGFPRQVGLALLDPPTREALHALADTLHQRGYASLERCTCVAGMRRALADGDLPEAERWHARALPLDGCVDAWVDTPDSLRRAAAELWARQARSGRAA